MSWHHTDATDRLDYFASPRISLAGFRQRQPGVDLVHPAMVSRPGGGITRGEVVFVPGGKPTTLRRGGAVSRRARRKVVGFPPGTRTTSVFRPASQLVRTRSVTAGRWGGLFCAPDPYRVFMYSMAAGWHTLIFLPISARDKSCLHALVIVEGVEPHIRENSLRVTGFFSMCVL